MTIPKILIRTVPEETSREIEKWWEHACFLHPGWHHITYRDPIDPHLFPITMAHWVRCKTGAQKAGLIRLEAVLNTGGVYIDSDVEVFKPFDPLLGSTMFAAWEDDGVVPDAIFGAEKYSLAVAKLLDEAIRRLYLKSTNWRTGNGAWSTGPGVFTEILPQRNDVLLLPPQAFYAVSYKERPLLGRKPAPYEFARHHWHASWLPPEMRV